MNDVQIKNVLKHKPSLFFFARFLLNMYRKRLLMSQKNQIDRLEYDSTQLAYVLHAAARTDDQWRLVTVLAGGEKKTLRHRIALLWTKRLTEKLKTLQKIYYNQ